MLLSRGMDSNETMRREMFFLLAGEKERYQRYRDTENQRYIEERLAASRGRSES